MNFFMFGDNIKTKIKNISREKNLSLRLFGVLELIWIAAIWSILSILFCVPKKLINYFAARAYAKQIAFGKNRKLRYLDLREMKVIKVVKEVRVVSRWQKFLAHIHSEITIVEHLRITQKSGKKWAFDVAVVSLMLIVIFQMSNFGQAAQYTKTWTAQNDFESNTVSTGTATTRSNVDTTSSAGDAKISAGAAVKTENSYSDFAQGTKSNTVLDSNAIKTMPTALANSWSSPAGSARVLRNGSDDDMYVLQGSSTGFYEYSPASRTQSMFMHLCGNSKMSHLCMWMRFSWSKVLLPRHIKAKAQMF